MNFLKDSTILFIKSVALSNPFPYIIGMNEELVNKIKAEIEALHIEIQRLNEEIKILKNKDALDISEEDPMELLDSIDEAAEGKETGILKESFARWKENIESAKILSKAPKAWTKDFGMMDDNYYK